MKTEKDRAHCWSSTKTLISPREDSPRLRAISPTAVRYKPQQDYIHSLYVHKSIHMHTDTHTHTHTHMHNHAHTNTHRVSALTQTLPWRLPPQCLPHDMISRALTWAASYPPWHSLVLASATGTLFLWPARVPSHAVDQGAAS